VIFKKGNREHFTIIDNDAVQDITLSFKARGLLAYLMSLPDDWQIYEQEITKHTTDGIKAVRSGIKELIFTGYISRSSQRNESGQFIGYEYLVYDKPQSNAILTIMPLSANGLRHTTNIHSTNNTDIYTKADAKIEATYDLERAKYLNG
jgi:hypothetical protein